MSDLRITVDDWELTAEWTDENPDTRRALDDTLPVSGDATRWGDELYFWVPVDVEPAETQTEVPEGAIAYWPTGNVLCLFWGPTPASVGDESRAASPVAVVGQIDDTSPLDSIEGGAHVEIDRA